MRRKPDVIDVLLEYWASWYYIYATEDFSLGNSQLFQFVQASHGESRPLWLGTRSNRKILALNHDLIDRLPIRQVILLVIIYGTPGPIYQKARLLKKTVSQLQTLCRKARRIALNHIPNHLTAEISHRDRYRH
ncbi:hypothetical protein [Endozoicomonas sp. SCSIO W0465]|uniref:hypothetical protein n=1 Tax=Endozoicomonas sp. SCSIO W0465 TaxID=2918516 RepID=UPI002075C120|nr:hypothetical protein [Endozoicomonas sp. SCSIO W0465]USE39260.1 hypothetical protein MJO57_14505 [Endozoicomonas sp. SCSIO W0465]